MVLVLTFLLTFNILIFYLLINLIGFEKFQLASIIAQTTSLLIIYLPLKQLNFRNSINDIQISKEFPVYIALIIVFGNAIIGMFNLDYLLSLIDFTEINEASGMNIGEISMFTGSASILVSQSGGFFIQIFLTYFLSDILDCETTFKEVFSILGTAYLGFLLISLIVFVYNMMFLEHFNSLNEFKNTTRNSDIYLVIGKLGEYSTLCIASFFFWKYKKIPPFKSISLVYIPNILLMLSYLMFNKIL